MNTNPGPKTAKSENRSPNPVLRHARNPALIVASIDDLLTEILAKLPIKHLIRFKLVSKHWLSLVTSHGFCLRRNPTPNPARGFFLGISDNRRDRYQYIPLYPENLSSYELPSFKLGFTTYPSKYAILPSCNGLLLCCTSNSWWQGFHHVLPRPDYAIHVYNPTTNSFAGVPNFPTGSRLGAALVFDPVKSPHYKVVLVVVYEELEKGPTPICHIQIYSSETRGWSSGGEIGMDWLDFNFRTGVYWNGSIHWLNRELSKTNCKISLRFHVDTRVLDQMPTPPVVRERNYWENYYFGESCDHLHFVEPILPRFNVYEMKRDYSEWFVKYKVDLSLFCAQRPEVFINGFDHDICVFSLIRDASGKDTKLVLRIPTLIVKVNVADGTYEEPVLLKFGNVISYTAPDSRDGMYSYYSQKAVDYIQSLYSV